MSFNFVKLIEEPDGDVYKVLRDVAKASKIKESFENSNWKDSLIRTFEDVLDSEDYTIINDDVDNIHEISNSFAEDTKFVKKYKTTVEDDARDDVKLDVNAFDDSNGSFEIPETQADPPINDDDLSSEGFVAIPDEEMPTNDGSQSPDFSTRAYLTQKSNISHAN